MSVVYTYTPSIHSMYCTCTAMDESSVYGTVYSRTKAANKSIVCWFGTVQSNQSDFLPGQPAPSQVHRFVKWIVFFFFLLLRIECEFL